MQEHPFYDHAAPILSVPHVPTAVTYYRDRLGFTVGFEWEEPATYAVLHAGPQIQIHLSQAEAGKIPPAGLAMYIFVKEIDVLYAQLIEKGVEMLTPIGDRDYGMRDFDVEDPFGYRWTFGRGA